MLAHQIAHGCRRWPELVLRRHAVGGALDDAGRHLLLQPGDPDLVELVEIAAEDAEELQPLEQRRRGNRAPRGGLAD